jgi:uncharacterized protein (TIGR00251 family)
VSRAPSPGPLQRIADGIRLRVRLSPGAARERLVGLAPDADGGVALKVAVNAPAVDGRANAALQALLARRLGVAKGTITVVAGATQRRKLLHIAGDPETLAARVGALIDEAAG